MRLIGEIIANGNAIYALGRLHLPKNIMFQSCLIVLLPVLFFGCRTVPVTERTQLMLSTESSENALGVSAYDEYRAKYRISSNAGYTAALQRCGNAIRKVANRDDFEWEFVLFDSPIKNAFCLPGGKVAFYSGIVDKMDNEAEMAFVMAHEIAHAIARHGGERISWGYIRSLGGILISLGLQNSTVNGVYGIGSELGVMLPFSRRDESEADYIGMLLMARAGYDPRASVAFWRRFSSESAASTVLDDLMSTHPCDEDRIAAMEEHLEAALEEYRKAANKREYGVTFRGGGSGTQESSPGSSDGDVSITL